MEQGQYDALLGRLTRIESLLLGTARAEVESEWLESEPAREMVGVSQKTWANWRKKRVIPFSQLGRKLWYKRADVEAFLESNLIK